MTDDRRAQILDAARTLFAVQQPAEVTIRDVCARAQLGNGSFFHAFKTKSDLMSALYKAACERRDREVEAALATWPDNAHRAIQEAVTALTRFLTSAETEACLLRRLSDATSTHALFTGDRDGLSGLEKVLAMWAKPMVAVHQIAPVTPRVLTVLLWGITRTWSDYVQSHHTEAASQEIASLAERLWQAIRLPAVEERRPRRVKPPLSIRPAEPGLL